MSTDATQGGGGPEQGRRLDNGLLATAYVPLTDLGAEAGRHVLTALGRARIAAYLEPVPGQHEDQRRLYVNADDFVPADVRERYLGLPDTVAVRDRDVEIQYDVEETATGTTGVARLRLPEKLARTLTPQELPELDRPMRFVVARGARGAARGDTLDELQEELDRPFTEAEIARLERDHEARRHERHERKRQRRTQQAGDELKEHRGVQSSGYDGRRRQHEGGRERGGPGPRGGNNAGRGRGPNPGKRGSGRRRRGR